MKWILIAAVVLSTGCRKCMECETTVTQTVNGHTTTTGHSTEELCGDELREADGRVVESTATVSGQTAVIKAATYCR